MYTQTRVIIILWLYYNNILPKGILSQFCFTSQIISYALLAPLDACIDIQVTFLPSEATIRLDDPVFDFFGPTTLYNVEIQAYSEDKMFISEPKNLTVEITWVNKPPQFTKQEYEASVPETEVHEKKLLMHILYHTPSHRQ